MTLNKVFIAVWRNGMYEPAGIVYFNKQNGIGGFQYLKSYNGAPLDPVHLNYQVSEQNPKGDRNFTLKSANNPELLHRVFQNFLPAKWAGSVMAADFPQMKNMCAAERLAFIGSRTVGGLSTRVIDAETKNEKPFYLKDNGNLTELSVVMKSSIEFFRKEIPSIDIPQAKWGLTSHGGARPKVAMMDSDGRHWVVKFDLPVDDVHASRLEHALAVLARTAGINIPDTKVISGQDGKEMFAIERYDREKGNGGRYFQTSMYSLMDERDVRAINEGDYKDIFNAIDKASTQPTQDKTELFRRMLFNVAVNNTDDHLENFSMILKDDKWQLTPAYDITLDPNGMHHTTSIFGLNTIDLYDSKMISNIAGKVGISAAIAHNICSEVVGAVSQWRSVFEQEGVSKKDMESVKGAFKVASASNDYESASPSMGY